MTTNEITLSIIAFICGGGVGWFVGFLREPIDVEFEIRRRDEQVSGLESAIGDRDIRIIELEGGAARRCLEYADKLIEYETGNQSLGHRIRQLEECNDTLKRENESLIQSATDNEAAMVQLRSESNRNHEHWLTNSGLLAQEKALTASLKESNDAHVLEIEDLHAKLESISTLASPNVVRAVSPVVNRRIFTHFERPDGTLEAFDSTVNGNYTCKRNEIST